MRLLATVALLPALATAVALPEAVGAYHALEGIKPQLSDRPVWDEYGLKDHHSVTYANGSAGFTLTAYQLSDPTAALAAFYWQRPASSKPSKAAPVAAETPDSLLLASGNYLLSFQGYKPSKTELKGVLGSLQGTDRASLPSLYLPQAGRVPNSERYITGPAGLQAFLPGIPVSAAGFSRGAEVQSAVFHSPKGDITLAVFNYPTPQIARKQLLELERAGLTVRRSGPLVGATLPGGGDLDLASALLAQVSYQAKITIPEYVPTRRDNIGVLVINAFVLIGIILSITLTAGLFVGIYRAYQHRGGRDPNADTIITLRL